MSGTAPEDQPASGVDDRLTELERWQKRSAGRIDHLGARLGETHVEAAWFQLSMTAALPLLGVLINLAVPWYSDDDKVGSGFSLIGGPRDSGSLLVYVLVATLAAATVTVLAGSTIRSSPASWYVVTGLAVVMTVAAVRAHGDLRSFEEPRAGLRLAVILPLALGVISLAAPLRLRQLAASASRL